ncbi:MAG TPA: hypothetical protein VJ965_04955 [Anaerolineales bacterium]|nr:hypothetical protein [Anaerolineales bacterium]
MAVEEMRQDHLQAAKEHNAIVDVKIQTRSGRFYVAIGKFGALLENLGVGLQTFSGYSELCKKRELLVNSTK